MPSQKPDRHAEVNIPQAFPRKGRMHSAMLTSSRPYHRYHGRLLIATSTNANELAWERDRIELVHFFEHNTDATVSRLMLQLPISKQHF